MAEEVKLDDLIVKEGTEYKKENYKTFELTYDTNIPVPGAKAEIPTSSDVALNESDAQEKLVADLAMEKLKHETDEQKIHDYVTQSDLRHQMNDFYNKYGYEMTGQQKRVMKHKIERAWQKGKYKLTEEQRANILFEVNKYSATANKANVGDVAGTSKNTVTSLSSLIH